MHDSRNAPIKVGDRVLIEAEVTELNGGDENFCCCTVAIILPEQAGQEKVMNHRPTVSAMSTRMLTKIGTKVITCIALLFAFALPSMAQESLTARLAQVEQNNSAIMSMLSAHKGALDNLQADVSAIRAELSAIKKASGVKLSPVSNWAGDAEFIASPRAGSSWSSSSSVNWSAMSMGGSCVNGSCGTSGILRGVLFGRRR